MRETVLLAFAIERRSITLCRFRGLVLEYAKKRELGVDQDEAERSAAGFFSWALEPLFPSRVAFEVDSDRSAARLSIQRVVEAVAKERGIPIWHLPKEQLYAAYGEPPIKSRAELRRVAGDLWPILSDRRLGRGALDAAALGLFVQCQAALNEIEEEARHARAA